MDRLLLGLAALYGLSGVAMGAFAAHALKGRLDDYALGIMQTATQYQLVHAVAMLAALPLLSGPGILPRWALWAFACGVLLFSGSLYALALSGVRALGAITPLGGLLLLAGWGLLLIHAFRGAPQ